MSTQGREWYAEMCRQPQWQKKRLEVMAGAGWKCHYCTVASDTLAVHHRYYCRGRKPWEYPRNAFRCLCEPCHESAKESDEERDRPGLVLDFMFGTFGDHALDKIMELVSLFRYKNGDAALSAELHNFFCRLDPFYAYYASHAPQATFDLEDGDSDMYFME